MQISTSGLLSPTPQLILPGGRVGVGRGARRFAAARAPSTTKYGAAGGNARTS